MADEDDPNTQSLNEFVMMNVLDSQMQDATGENWKPKRNEPLPKEAVQKLLDIYREHTSDFNCGRKQKKLIWMQIANEMQQAGIQMSADKCGQKWRNMVRTYTVFLERLQQPVEGETIEVPWYFEQMASILNERHFLSVNEGDEASPGTADNDTEGSSDVKPVSVVVKPAASRVAMSALAKRLSAKRPATRSAAADNSDVELETQCEEMEDDEEEEEERIVATELTKARKRTRSTAQESPLLQKKAKVGSVINAIREAEASRRAEEDARHNSLLQELRRQHYEKMAVLGNILDVLRRNGPQKDATSGAGKSTGK